MRFAALGLAIAAAPAFAAAQEYPPLSEYMMDRDEEIAMARSAAPAHISADASVMVLTRNGYQLAEEGDNGFLCVVLRGYAAPTFEPKDFRNFVYLSKLRAPICYDANAAHDIFPLQQLKTRLGMEGKSPDEIGQAVATAYARGELPAIERVSFAYMMSGHQDLDGDGEAGDFVPHTMVYAPGYRNETLGGNPFGSRLPFIVDDPGTPFAVATIAGADVEFNYMPGAEPN
ncbi:MAG: hypothetical protein Tsb0010_02910 [Parvularculaceae bacterium]